MKENSGENKYAANERIDELLNSFIDGELPAAQRVQVEDLIARDVQVARRLRQLQKCKTLVGALPRVEIPLDVAEGIRAQMESPIGDLRSSIFNRSGRPDGAIEDRSLVRRVLAVAATIGLAAVLAGVIYTILAPPATPERPVAVESPRVRQGTPGAIPITSFSGHLELRTSDLATISTFVNRAIEDKGISQAEQQDKRIYSVSCTAKQFNALLTDMETIWPGLDSATLFVNTDVFGKPVAVNNVTTAQIARIAEQSNSQKRIEVAKSFDAMNTLVARLPDKEIRVAIEGTNDSPIREWRAPKPVLTTSDRKPAQRPSGENEEPQTIHLTIAVNW